MLGLVLDCGASASALFLHFLSSVSPAWLDGLPFPFDHFFFCFLAPDAAGAILTDGFVEVLGVGIKRGERASTEFAGVRFALSRGGRDPA